MEVRSIQKTGKMHYLYLPTSWCKRYRISSETKVYLTENNDGTLLISSEKKEQAGKSINLTLPFKYRDSLINLIMACYVNPASSFKIKLERKVNMASLLDQKNLMSGMEFVELDGENITYESSMSVNEPDSLLKTMVKKGKNLIYVMLENNSPALVQKYEEEIDRSKMLIQKAVISSLALNQSTPLKAIDMYYTLQIAIELERMFDYLIQIGKDGRGFLREVAPIMDSLKDILEEITDLEYLEGLHFTKQVSLLSEYKNTSLDNSNKNRIKKHFQNIAEVLLDWSITKSLENK